MINLPSGIGNRVVRTPKLSGGSRETGMVTTRTDSTPPDALGIFFAHTSGERERGRAESNLGRSSHIPRLL